jgi:acetate---CoA ligase (ADP-forming)
MSGLFRLFEPRGVAVVGASDDPASVRGRPLAYLLRAGFVGGIYPIHPTKTDIQSIQAYSKVSEAPGPVDVAVVVAPADQLPKILMDS